MAAGVVDEAGTVLVREQVPTQAADGNALFTVLTDLVDRVRDQAGVPVAGCGIGTGGPMTRGGETITPLNIGQWQAFPLRSAMADHTGVATWVDNDAKALALGEGWIGAAAGHRDYLAMVVSTGVGGGIVLDGRLLDGHAANAGHIGHLNVVPDGRACRCGSHGCLEAEASGTAIAAITGRPPKEADEAMRVHCGTVVGRAVGSVATLLDLPLVLVAGSVALGYGDVFFAAAQAEIDRVATIEFARGTTIRPGGLGDRGPLVGAAAVGFRGLGHDIGVA